MSVCFFLPVSLLFSTTVIISPDMGKHPLCAASPSHVLCFCLCLSMSLCLDPSAFLLLCVCFFFGLSIFFPLFSPVPIYTHTRTHVRRTAVRFGQLGRFVCTGAELDVEIRQTRRDINVLNQATLQLVDLLNITSRQQNLLGKLRAVLNRPVCIHFVSPTRESYSGSASVSRLVVPRSHQGGFNDIEVLL